MLQIASLKLQSNLILAPMAGISDLPFRMLNRQFGCELAFVEMINVRSLSFKSRKTKAMLSQGASDRPLGVQILGSDPGYIKRAMDILRDYAFDVLDFNAACPVKKVIRRGEGASLLRHPSKLASILKLIAKSSWLPVSVKIRSGWDGRNVNAREIALAAEDAGVDCVFIHGRTKMQGYSGAVDYDAIRQAKKALKIPVIGSGDILSEALAEKMMQETGCDGIAVARGALGNPWIFKGVASYLKNGIPPKPPYKEEIIEVMRQHFQHCVDFYGERNGVIIFRKFFAWYTRGFRKIRPLREKVSRVKTKNEMIGIMAEL